MAKTDIRCRLAGLVGAVLLLAAPGRAAEGEGGIAFQENLAQALRQAATEPKRVVVVYFSTTWCQWCRKMQVTTFTDRRVKGMAGRFVWAHVDTERQPLLAAWSGIRGVPCVVLLNAEGEVLASQSGYLTADQLLELLRKHVDKASAPGPGQSARDLVTLMKQKLESIKPDQRRQGVMDVVSRMAQSDRVGRQGLADGLRQAGLPACEVLVECLEDKRLAVRAAAGEALADISGEAIEYDPFLDPPQRAAQVAAWKAWVVKEKADPASFAPASRPAGRPVGPGAISGERDL